MECNALRVPLYPRKTVILSIWKRSENTMSEKPIFLDTAHGTAEKLKIISNISQKFFKN
jgi:hypothetical protein